MWRQQPAATPEPLNNFVLRRVRADPVQQLLLCALHVGSRLQSTAMSRLLLIFLPALAAASELRSLLDDLFEDEDYNKVYKINSEGYTKNNNKRTLL